MRASPNNRKLSDLVRQAKAGVITLPQFQRNFVWPRRSVESLLDSLLRDHYIGALLFLETDREHMPFGHRPIAGINTVPEAAHPENLVLDGQQRITALHYAFAAPERSLRDTSYPYRFFLDLDKLGDLEEAEGIVWSQRADLDWVRQLEQPEIQYERKTLPFTELLRWEDWKNGYDKWIFGRDQQAGMEHHVSGEQTRWDEAVRRIRDADVPVVTLDKISSHDRSKVRQICEVFEKLNSTGLKLTVFDLLTARLYRDGVDLHWLWKYSLQSYPLLRRFAGGEPDVEEADSNDFGVLLLRTVALLREREVRSKRLIELDTTGFEEDWEKASEAMEKALERVTSTAAEGFGAFNRRWLPYTTILPVLAAITYKLKEANAGADAYSALRRWYWSSVFLGRYSGSTETVAYADFQDVMRHVRGKKEEPDVFAEARTRIGQNPGFSLRGISRIGAADYRGVMNLIALGGAKDFVNNDGITFHDLDDHHIFPQAFLRDERSVKGDGANTIVNRTLIAGATNRKISKKSPSDYLQNVLAEEHRETILASHFVDAEARAAMQEDDYEAFLAARERSLIAKITDLVS